ncbi:hypothetical protein BEWA_009250 [Theileria equi strain WA]|uniref:NOT2/NOT3/NOT5 C-terminal domain-containing protein n=1 Tax=Theileria equi strain WA TaxID=1537102 RepID=L0B0X7_THEEQ|nr:hypothetical protein BEWA_009250 [Theileria equi strain WA]AFZ81512.1 hypothetical protein BEWA_009250 [Theileria equi strain WA]|eukprot:XP_004831178.1 hypothetical protein BEWA_009250 [Theileria equi strain WA]
MAVDSTFQYKQNDGKPDLDASKNEISEVSVSLDRLKVTDPAEVLKTVKIDTSKPVDKPRSDKVSDEILYGIEGIFDALKQYDGKSPFLPTGKLDVEGLKKKLLDDNLFSSYKISESIFYDSPSANNYDKIVSPRNIQYSKFSLETCFYIFYNMPRDTFQVSAATELLKRKWLYSKAHKLWFKSTQSEDKVVWTCFDPSSWTQKTLETIGEVEKTLLSQEEMEQLIESTS